MNSQRLIVLGLFLCGAVWAYLWWLGPSDFPSWCHDYPYRFVGLICLVFWSPTLYGVIGEPPQ